MGLASFVDSKGLIRGGQIDETLPTPAIVVKDVSDDGRPRRTVVFDDRKTLTQANTWTEIVSATVADTHGLDTGVLYLINAPNSQAGGVIEWRLVFKYADFEREAGSGAISASAGDPVKSSAIVYHLGGAPVVTLLARETAQAAPTSQLKAALIAPER